MKRSDLEILSVDELWDMHQKITAMLKAKPERRPYPTVFPKFRNPEQPSETWAGRGKKPRWLAAQLKSGKQIDDFRIDF